MGRGAYHKKLEDATIQLVFQPLVKAGSRGLRKAEWLEQSGFARKKRSFYKYLKLALKYEYVAGFTPLLQLPDSFVPKYKEKPPSPGNVSKWRTKRLDKGKLFDKEVIKHAAKLQSRKRNQMYRMTVWGLEWYRKRLG